MKISYLSVGAALVLLLLYNISPAGDSAAERNNTPIHVTSDRLEAYSGSDRVVFTGNVHAVSADFDITSDSLEIFYANTDSPGAQGQPLSIGPAKSIREIIATGNVTIVSGGKTAKTEKALYSGETGIVELIGPGSTVTGESGTISGGKIAMNTRTGDVTVEGGEKTRVEAIIKPQTGKEGKTGAAETK